MLRGNKILGGNETKYDGIFIAIFVFMPKNMLSEAEADERAYSNRRENEARKWLVNQGFS